MWMQEQRQAVIDYSRQMVNDELTLGTSGNVSLRSGDHIAITPTGIAYDQLTPDMIPVIDTKGRQKAGDLAPSSEVPMHTMIYQAQDTQAVVHTHPLYGTALGLVADETPRVHYMLALCGGPVRVAEYATYGSAELAENIRQAMVDRSAVLLRNHGATSWGQTLADAYRKALYLEWCCRLWVTARGVGEPSLLSEAQFAEALAHIKDYGKQPASDDDQATD